MIYVILGIVLVCAAILDLRTGKIPNMLIVAGLILGLICRIGAGGIWFVSIWPQNTGISGVLPVLLLAALLWLLFRLHALGAGDVKLFAVIASMSEPTVFISVFLFSFMAAAIYACFKLAVHKELVPCLIRFSQYIRDSVTAKQLMPYPRQDRLSMHFAVAILAGYFMTMGVIGCSNW